MLLIRSFLYFSLGLLFLSCNQKAVDEKYSSFELILMKEQVFNTGFEARKSVDRTYVIDNEEFVGFENAQTYKKIVFHSLTTAKKYEIPVDEVLKKGEKILHYDVINLDTIILISAYTNNMYFINSEGFIWGTLDINSVVPSFDQERYTFEVGGIDRPFLYNDSSMILNIVPRIKNPFSPFSFKSYFSEINKDTLPYLLKVNNIFSDSIDSKFGLYNFYHRFSTVNDYPYGRNRLSYGNNKLLIKEDFSDSLYVVNPITLTVEKAVLIESDFITTPIKVPMLTLKEVDNGYNVGKRILEFPYLSQNICFSEKFQKYFFSIQSPNNDFFVICVYNTSFIKTDEIKLSKAEYGAFKCLTIKSEIVVSDYKKYSDRADFFEINSLSLFDYVEK